jgi:SAM-dependent methyltransferase
MQRIKMATINRAEEYYSKSTGPIGEELTLSHLLRHKNSFLGMTYGEKLVKALVDKKIIRKGSRVLEVGFGLGDVARAFTDLDCNYIGLDRSRPLMKECMAAIEGDKKFSFVLADALNPPFKEGVFDLIVCNEVLSDLPAVVEMENGKPPKMKSSADEAIYKDALRMISQYALSEKAPSKFNFNYGAIRFLELTKSLLAKGGSCLIIENSCDNKTRYASNWPAKISVIGHDEYNIKFSWLAKAAAKIGFAAESGTVTDLFSIKDGKFVCVLLNQQIRSLYDFYKRNEVDNFLVRYASYIYSPEEFLARIKEEMSAEDLASYKNFAARSARNIREISDQFLYLILKN